MVLHLLRRWLAISPAKNNETPLLELSEDWEPRESSMERCLAVSAEGKNGCLALMWKEGNKVTIQNYSKYHIDSLVKMEDGTDIRFTGFYGQADPTLRNQAWDMLRRIKSNIVGGDFNAILNNVEKDGGRRKPQNLMNDFRELLEELTLVDIKTSVRWFTWSNNRKG
ncbi:reverse transcriptase [Gossypium australe]|uniref:Reverse transcriptase n=1 Tax=Gossypium australe TaxID=47621 RepID=A0A5B6WI27_9ROSI|nr:reverse transcriptase [Gossypium australe]